MCYWMITVWEKWHLWVIAASRQWFYSIHFNIHPRNTNTLNLWRELCSCSKKENKSWPKYWILPCINLRKWKRWFSFESRRGLHLTLNSLFFRKIIRNQPAQRPQMSFNHVHILFVHCCTNGSRYKMNKCKNWTEMLREKWKNNKILQILTTIKN